MITSIAETCMFKLRQNRIDVMTEYLFAFMLLGVHAHAFAQIGPGWPENLKQNTKRNNVNTTLVRSTAHHSEITKQNSAVSILKPPLVSHDNAITVQATGSGVIEAIPLLATSESATMPPEPACPGGYKKVWSYAVPMGSRAPLFLNIAGTKLSFTGFNPANAPGVGWMVDGPITKFYGESEMTDPTLSKRTDSGAAVAVLCTK